VRAVVATAVYHLRGVGCRACSPTRRYRNRGTEGAVALRCKRYRVLMACKVPFKAGLYRIAGLCKVNPQLRLRSTQQTENQGK